jgi:hypothetical protein
MKIETLEINNLKWSLEFACDNVYYCAEKDRYAVISDNEIEHVGFYEECLALVNS